LLLSETEAERLQTHIAPVRLDILLSKALDMFSGVAEHRGIDLVATPFNQATILGISQHVQQVIYNLLDNALKFTSAGGRVEVFLECREGTVWLTVSDTGIGIDPSELPLVFDRFFRGSRHLPLQSLNDLPETKRRGTGLGLSICRAIVVAHHGNVEVSSIPGRGTTFRVSFPLASN
jgi:signal transduction histidine kinase